MKKILVGAIILIALYFAWTWAEPIINNLFSHPTETTTPTPAPAPRSIATPDKSGLKIYNLPKTPDPSEPPKI